MIKRYLITDPSYYSTVSELREYLKKIYLSHKIDYSCFRDKKNLDILPYAEAFLEISNTFNINKTLINGDYLLADKLGFWGVHLRGDQFSLIELAKSQKLNVIISTHSEKEVVKAEKKGVYAVTYSPIFSTPNKGKPKGVKSLYNIVKRYKVKCFALGGIISEKEVENCRKSNIYGFASIRYFTNNSII